MQVQVEDLGPTRRKVSVTVPAEQVEAAFAKVYREIGRTAQIPGFRPGKAPRGLIEAHYGARAQREVESELVETTLARAIVESKLSPIARPQIESGTLARGDAYSYSAHIEIQPDIQLRRYKKLLAPRVPVEVQDSEVEADLEGLRKRAAQLVPVLLRDVADKGDVVVMDYQATINGNPVPNGKAENALIEVGGEGYLPGLADGLLGAKVPGERTLSIAFPADYSAKDLAGQTALFHVKLKELKRQETPSLDDDFAKDLGVDTLAELRTKLRGTLQLKKQNQAEQERRSVLLKALVAANPFELSPVLVQAQAEQMVAGAAQRVERMMGKPLQLSAEDVARLRQENEPEAEQQVRSGILLLELAKREGLQVPDAEVDRECEALAIEAGDDEQRVRAFYQDAEHRNNVRYRLLEERTVAFLLSQAAETQEEAAVDNPVVTADPATTMTAAAAGHAAPEDKQIAPAADPGSSGPDIATAGQKKTKRRSASPKAVSSAVDQPTATKTRTPRKAARAKKSDAGPT